MATMFRKDVNDIVDFTIDWSALLETGETILTSTYTFFTVAKIITTDITEDSSMSTDTTTTIFIAGGVVDTTYLVANQITTSGGRTYERSFYLRVLEMFV